jgi:hypothetical protein
MTESTISPTPVDRSGAALVKQKDWLYWLLVAIAAMTVISGIAQASDPALILVPLQAQVTPTTEHFFGIVGMFMVLFGGLMLNALLGRADQPVAVFWAALQKLGAFAAVALGVMHGIFSHLALWVAVTDLASGILAIVYWRRIQR